jgi:formylglycine-generating enzyme required for sulfatase activity
VLTELRRQFIAGDEDRKLRLAYALANFGDVRVDFLVSQVASASPDEVDNSVHALGKSSGEAVSVLEAAAQVAETHEDWRLKSRLAMLAWQLNSPKLAREMCQCGPDPTQRSWFIEECSTWHGDLENLADQLADCEDRSLQSGIALTVGSVPVAKVLASEKQAWNSMLSSWFTDNPDTLIHSTAGWVIRQWGLTEPKTTSTSLAGKKKWRVNGVGMTLLEIPSGSFVRKAGTENAIDQTVTLSGFLLSDREVTRKQFQQIMDDPDAEKPDWPGAIAAFNPTPQHPVNNVNWHDAVMYCNWLSLREGLTPCYERTGKRDTASRGGDDDAWRLVPGADGYRLPTEAEWEYVCRAGTLTKFSFGDDDESFMDRYGVVLKSRMEIPGSKLPNGWGVFDAHGNAHEWCHDWYGAYDGEATTIGDPKGPAQGSSRVLRGGSFAANAHSAQSSLRATSHPDNRHIYTGFRVARTYR